MTQSSPSRAADLSAMRSRAAGKGLVWQTVIVDTCENRSLIGTPLELSFPPGDVDSQQDEDDQQHQQEQQGRSPQARQKADHR